MALDNPAFSRNSAFSERGTANAPTANELQDMYNRPSAPYTPGTVESMTIEDTLAKSVATFAVLLLGAAAGWLTVGTVPFLWTIAGTVGLVLALVNIFKQEPSPALILGYSAAQGVFIGGISAFYEARYPGVVMQAVIATLVVVGVTLALFASGKIRATAKATKIFLIAMIGYAVFSLVNVLLMIFGVNKDPWGLLSTHVFGIPLGLIVGVLVVIMAAYSLVLDFDFIQQGVRNKAPRKFGWTGAFGIMVTVIWLYLELLRIFAISRD